MGLPYFEVEPVFCLVSSSRRLKKPELSSSAPVLDIGFGPRHQDTERCSADAGAEENEGKEKRCIYKDRRRSEGHSVNGSELVLPSGLLYGGRADC